LNWGRWVFWMLLSLPNWFFHIFFNHIEIWLRYYLTGWNNEATVVRAYEINHGIWLDPLKSSVEVDNMLTWIFHKYCNVLTTYRDNDILLERALGIYVNVRLIFAYSVDCFMNFFDFLQWELEKFSLILRIFFIFSDNACIYDCSSFLSNQFGVLMLLFLP